MTETPSPQTAEEYIAVLDELDQAKVANAALRSTITRLEQERDELSKQAWTFREQVIDLEMAMKKQGYAAHYDTAEQRTIRDLRSRIEVLEGALTHLLDHDSCIRYRSSCDWPKDAAAARTALSQSANQDTVTTSADQDIGQLHESAGQSSSD